MSSLTLRLNMKKIGIVGCGFVGNAVNYGFSTNVEKFLVDPKLGTTLFDLKSFDPEFIFICVPTPMNKDGGQDSTIIEKVLLEINNTFENVVVIVKSTVLPNTILNFSKITKHLVYNPEFLREKTANEDFISSNSLILGGNDDDLVNVISLYKNYSDCNIEDVYKTDVVSASLVKYAINTFLASKVIFFNQLHSIYKNLIPTEDWDNFIKIVSSDDRIGNSHMNVPGHDGELGFGGTCFPKDTLALLKLSNSLNNEFSLLKEVIKINNGIKGRYENLEKREEE
jgi:nucleotide sugar dehydrogenase